MFKIVIADDEGQTRTVDLVDDVITIGRKSTNTIHLADENVSRRHARLVRRDGGYVLHDLGSYNGVTVNGRRIEEPRPLEHGDRVLIGDYTLTYAAGDAALPPPSPPAVEAPDEFDAHDAHLTSEPPPPPAAAGGTELPEFRMAMSTAALQAAAARGAVPPEVRGMRLVFLAPDDAPPPVTLEKLPLVLGREAGADVVLPYESVAPRHLRLLVRGGELHFEDLSGTPGGGVLVDDVPTEQGKLAVGAMLKLGDVVLRVARRSYSGVVIQTARDADEPDRAAPSPLLRPWIWLVAAAVFVAGVVVFSRPPDAPPPLPPRHAATDAGAASEAAVRAPQDADAALAGDEAIPLGPDESVADRLASAHAAMDEDMDFDRVVALLAPLHEHPGVTPEQGIEASLLETTAYVAQRLEDRASAACERAVTLSRFDPDLARRESPRVRAACRAAAERLRRDG